VSGTYYGFFDLSGGGVGDAFENVPTEGLIRFEQMQSVGKPQFVNGVESGRQDATVEGGDVGGIVGGTRQGGRPQPPTHRQPLFRRQANPHPLTQTMNNNHQTDWGRETGDGRREGSGKERRQ